MTRPILLLSLIPLLSAPAYAAPPQLLGHGVKSCAAYLKAYAGWDAGQEARIEEYLRYRSWLSGFVSGLNLATGEDMLRGVATPGAMRRIQLYCDEHPDKDFFTASMSLIRLLSNLEQDNRTQPQ